MTTKNIIGKMKQLGKRILRNTVLMFLGLTLGSIQCVNAQQIDIGIFESTALFGDLDIKIIPDITIPADDVIDGILFTIRWPEAYGPFSFVSGFASPPYLYQVGTQGTPVLNAGYYYQVFGATPTSTVGTEILAGEEVLLTVYTINEDYTCASFEIIDDAWTQANNGGPYFSYLGTDYTGIIYEPIVNFGSVGGFVAGGSTINLGQSTGTLTLTDYDGTILKWQKRVYSGTWIDIANTSTTYSEIPSSTGIWEYRAEVQEGTCPAVMSIPAVVSVESLDVPSIWTGTTDTDWFKASNWTVGVPNATLSGIIPPTENQPQISSLTIAEANDLTIESEAVLSIETDGFLTVLGTLSNATGNSGLVIRSDASKTGSLIHSTVGVAATSERYINNWTTGNENLGWHFLSSPVSAQPIRPEFIPLGNPLPSQIDFFKWDEDHVGPSCLGCWINTKDDAGIWNTAFENNFVVGSAYLVAYTAPYGDMVKNFMGQLNISDFTITNLSYTPAATHPGWHLIGNPFASALDWTTGSWVKTNIGAIPQIWEESAASYELIDNIGGDNSIIPANNGFMVFTDTDNSNTLTIPADARVHNAIPWYKNLNVLSIRLLANDLDKGLRQQTTIRVIPDATVEFDLQYDSYFLAGFAPMFYSVHEEDALALNSMPEINDNTIIPLYFVNNGSENYNIELSSAPPYMNIILHDLKLNIITNLKEDPIYVFTSFSGDDPHRFQLGFDAVSIDEIIDNVGITGWYANNILSIRSEQDRSMEVYIYNSLGQLVRQENYTGMGTHKLQLSLSSGMYIARVTFNNQVTPIKFFVAN